MLVLQEPRLVFLANPKTATQAIRAMLRPHALQGPWQGEPGARHAGILPFDRKWRARIEAQIGHPVETFAVLRDPLARLDSWHRYRKKNPPGDPRSTQGVDFPDFLRAVLSDDPPDYARVGAQDRFLGWDGAGFGVDVVFDYARLDLLVTFLSDRLGERLRLPQRNASVVARADIAVPDDLLAELHAKRAAEFACHRAVAETGVRFRDD